LKVKIKFFNNNVLIYTALIITSIITPFLVSKQFTSIHDLAYYLTNSLRIYNGQVMYRDFISVHTPGSFWVSAFLYKIFGFSYWPTYLWMFFVNIISTICIYKITIELGISKHLRILGTFSFGLLGPYSFFSQIWYDSDTIFFVIINVYLLLLSVNKIKNKSLLFICGILSFLPFVFKQNIGLVTLLSINFLIVFIYKAKFKNKFLFFLGQIVSISFFLLNLIRLDALYEFYFYTFKYASTARFNSFITDIFPIRFIYKYNYELKFEGLYYLSYLLICVVCLKLFLSVFQKKFNKVIFVQFLILIFSFFIYFDKYIFNEILNFTSNYLKFDTFEINKLNLSLSFFILFTALNIFLVNIQISNHTLIKFYINLLTVITTIFFISFVNKIIFSETIQEKSLVSFEYYLKIIFFIYFPVIIISLFIGFKQPNRYAVLTFPFVGYLYGTSLSQGVAGSTAASVGILMFLNLLVFDYLNVEHKEKNKFPQVIFLSVFSLFLFTTAIFGSRYFFIKYEDSTSSLNNFSFINLPSNHFNQQKDAQILLDKYGKDFKNISFVPEATLAYFLNQTKINVDVHTFDTTTNPYGVLFDTDTIEYFLECNNVEIVIVNTNPHRFYFDQFINSEMKIRKYLGLNYYKIEDYNDFKIYKQIKKLDAREYCDLLNNFNE